MNRMNAFNDDHQDSGIPFFGRNGTALSHEERANIARKRGVCLKCGRKTHHVKVLSRTPLTNDDIYQGTCIRCYPQAVPTSVREEWSARNPPASAGPGNRFRTVAHVARMAAHNNAHRGSPVPQQTIITAEVAPAASRQTGQLQRVGSSNKEKTFPRLETLNQSEHLPRHPVPQRATSDLPARPAKAPLQTHHAVSTGQLPNSISPQGIDSDEYKSGTDADSWTLLQEIKSNRDNPDILRMKIHGFRNLADDQAGAMYELKDVMDKWRNDRRLMMVAFGAIWGICSRDDDKKQESVTTGCLDSVLDALHNGTTKDDAEVTHWAMGTLACLAELDDNKQYIADKGGFEIVLNSLSKHSSHPTVFEWATRFLFTMIYSWDDNTSERDFERDMLAIEKADGALHIVAAAKKHLTEPVAQWWAFKLLFRLHDRSDQSVADRFAASIIAEDFPSHCIKVLKARSTTPLLFIHACEMLSMLLAQATDSNTQQNTTECISIAMSMMDDHPSNLELYESCAKLLASVALGNSQAKRQISEGNVARALLQNMIKSPDNVELVRNGFHFLNILSSDETSFDFALMDQIKEAIETCVASNPSDQQCNASICGLIANVSTVAHGKVDFIPMDVLLQFSSSCLEGETGIEVGRALTAVCSKFPDVTSRFVDSGICDRLLEGLCDSKVEVQNPSARCLAGLAAQSDVAKTKVVDSGGLGTASAALLTTSSESLTESLFVFISILTVHKSSKVLQLPNEIVQAVLHGMRTFPNLNKQSCTAIRNIMLLSVRGFSGLNTDGLVDSLCGIIDESTNNEEVVEACGALWAFASKQSNQNTSVLNQLFRSILGLFEKHKGEGGTQFNGPILSEAAGALASILHLVRESPIHIQDNDVDLIIAILDIAIECDVNNIVLMDLLMDSIITLCFLSKDALLQFGVIVVVIDCMVEHETSEIIQQKGCAVLALLASTENLQVNLSIAETDGIDMIVSALANFSTNQSIQTDACRSLSHLSIDHESRMLISSQGGLILLVNAMRQFRDDLDLLEAACAALLNLSSDAEEQVIAGSNVIESVIGIMRYQLNSPRLQEKCLGVLQNISMRSRDSKRRIADHGGVSAVTFAMKEFLGSPTVLERAFTTLWSLAVLEQNQHQIADEGGISLVINGMMANITYMQVQKQACGCLCTLSSDSRNKTLIRDLGGVDAIVYAMWSHYNSDALLIEACRALSSLAVNVQTNEVMIASEGEIRAIMSALRRFPQSERLQEHGCVALRNFLLSADNAVIVRSEATELEELVSAAAQRFPERCGERARQVLASIR